MARGFGPKDAKRFYDRFGSKQDWQAFYENPAVDELVAHADFGHARAVFELGFGTGRIAERLLSGILPQGASYTGIDISTTMARLAEQRLERWKKRATVKAADGTAGIDAPDGSFDRFVSVYVLDLLSQEEISCVLAEARRILVPRGRLCLVSLTRGTTAWCRLVSRTWEFLYRSNPSWVGGCRPIELDRHLSPDQWGTQYRNIVSSFGITSEIIVASRI
jgi:ubiquinone/menaquinone biosynthesis C-methylase UbiE